MLEGLLVVLDLEDLRYTSFSFFVEDDEYLL